MIEYICSFEEEYGFLVSASMKYGEELIRCRDCKYHHEAHYEEDGEKPIIKHKCKLLKGYQFSAEHYCGLAKRKEE